MKNILVILTYAFPFNPPTEQFLLAEIPFLSQKFDSIYFVPTSRLSSAPPQYLFESQKVHTLKIVRKRAFFEYLGGFFSFQFLNPYFWIDLFRIIFNKSFFSKETFLSLIDFYFKSFSLAKTIKKLFLKKKMFSKNDRVLIYSYWFNGNSIVGAKLKKFFIRKGFFQTKMVSRAHGLGDLYVKYLPRKPLLNSEVDKIYPISLGGKEFLTTLGISAKIMQAHKLGVPEKRHGDLLINKIVHIVSCSVLNENKRVLKIVEALSLIKDKEIYWTHFGDGPEFENVQLLCKQRLPENIHWFLPGKTENEKIIDFYLLNAPRCLINVSRIEGIPVSIMEAFSCGIPVIATNVGATSEIIKNGQNGFLLNSNFSDRELADLIIQLSFSLDLYSSMRNEAFVTWQQDYDSNKNFSNFSEDLFGLFSK